MSHVGLYFQIKDPDRELLIARLSVLGFEGFEETEDSLKAFIHADDFDSLKSMPEWAEIPNPFETKEIPHTNWNKIWEASYQPIVVSNQLYVRASFHASRRDLREVIINPQMSFGTGHHETTKMMLEFILKEEMLGKTVLDVGCGTGILSIASSLFGARSVLSLDNDENCVRNTKENIALNDLTNIVCRVNDDNLNLTESFDYSMMNINLHAIKTLVGQVASVMKQGAILFVSGIRIEDRTALVGELQVYGLELNQHLTLGEWLSCRFQKI